MNLAPLDAFPLTSKLGILVKLLLVLNVLLTGLAILFAWQAEALRARVRDLEKRGRLAGQDTTPPPDGPHSRRPMPALSDDRPIPAARHPGAGARRLP